MSSLYVYITHWQSSEYDLHFPKRVLRNLLVWGVEKLQVVGVHSQVHPVVSQIFHLGLLNVDFLKISLITNRVPTFSPESIIQVSGRDLSNTQVQTTIVDPNKLSDPFLLTWSHKELVRSDVEESHKDSAFLYLEHDQLFTQRNLDYFWANAYSLSKWHVRPSFIRIEPTQGTGSWVYTDATSPLETCQLRKFQVDTNTWIENPLPYAGMYLMTKEDTICHLENSSSNQQLSASKFPRFGISERAAMGNAFEDLDGASALIGWPVVTTNFVRIDNMSTIDPDCFVWHLSNRYGMNDLASRFRKFGSIPIPKGSNWQTSR